LKKYILSDIYIEIYRMKKAKKYTTIQISIEVHKLLKEYCNSNKKYLSGYVENLVLKDIEDNKLPKKILRVKI
jgi:hypothetical protein